LPNVLQVKNEALEHSFHLKSWHLSLLKLSFNSNILLLVNLSVIKRFIQYLIQTKDKSLIRVLPASSAPAAGCSQQTKKCSALSGLYL